MSYNDQLVKIWPSLQSNTTSAKLDELNAMTVPGPSIDIPIGNVIGYLGVTGKLVPLQIYSQTAPTADNQAAIFSARTFFILIGTPTITSLQTSDAGTLAAIQNFFAAIVADPASGIVQADADTILAMSKSTVPWWEANGFPSIPCLGDVIALGLS